MESTIKQIHKEDLHILDTLIQHILKESSNKWQQKEYTDLINNIYSKIMAELLIHEDKPWIEDPDIEFFEANSSTILRTFNSYFLIV